MRWLPIKQHISKHIIPVEFYAALIRSVEEDTDELSNYIYETQSHWIAVLSPNINISFNHVAAIKNEIRLWFFSIKGLGIDIGETIQKERQSNGKFQSLEDFLKRCQQVVNKKSLEWLIKSWALDEFGDRKTMLENSETLLQRAKSSQQMDGGLFGSMDVQTKISYKTTHETLFVEKLMMDQDVFKAFVSWHPLDGLYYYIKKYSFISQFKGKEKSAGAFIIIGYIKNIQRAKKKGFFIEIEDISGKMEFFVKEPLDLKKFDIVIVHLFKQEGRSPNIDKIIRTSRDLLIKQAGDKYNPEITSIKAKILRSHTDTHENKEKKLTPIIQSPKQEKPQKTNEFAIPDTMEKIQQLSSIIKTYPGEINVRIWSKEFMLTDEWIQKLQELYKKE
jgi:DNA polymerase III alpha subunit